MGWPVASMRRSAVTARWRVCSARRRAAAMTWRELSARIGGLRFAVLLDFADHLVQAGEDLLVHLGDPGLAVPGRGLDEGERAVPLLAQLGQELRPGEEDRAGQARVGVRAALLDGQAAVAVGQGLGGYAVPGLGPLGLAERAVGVEGDALAIDVDLGGLFPAPPHRLVGDLGVKRGHPV